MKEIKRFEREIQDFIRIHYTHAIRLEQKSLAVDNLEKSAIIEVLLETLSSLDKIKTSEELSNA